MTFPWRRQYLSDPIDTDVIDVVDRVGGLNAQTARGPVVGIYARLRNFRLAELDEARSSYHIVKANLIRGTVHLVTREQYWAWRLACQPALQRVVTSEVRTLWDKTSLEELLRVGRDIVGNHDGMTRGEMGRAAAERIPGCDPTGLGFALRMLLPVVEKARGSSWRPDRGTRYVLAQTVMPGGYPDDDTALDRLRGDFVRGFGPGRIADFSYWSGLPRSTIADLDWVDEGEDEQHPPRAMVLPEFDNLYFCRRAATENPVTVKRDPRVRAAALPGTLLTEGRVVGLWRHTADGRPELESWEDADRSTSQAWLRFQSWYESQSAARPAGVTQIRSARGSRPRNQP